jgi:hypothetical protein
MSYLQLSVLSTTKDIYTAEESRVFLFCKPNLCNHLSPKADIGYVTYANLPCVASYLRIGDSLQRFRTHLQVTGHWATCLRVAATLFGRRSVRISTGTSAILTVFSWFYSFLPGTYRDNTLIGHDHFFPNPFQIIIHLSSIYSTLYTIVKLMRTSLNNK